MLKSYIKGHLVHKSLSWHTDTQTDRQTDRHTGPIYLQRPVIWSVTCYGHGCWRHRRHRQVDWDRCVTPEWPRLIAHLHRSVSGRSERIWSRHFASWASDLGDVSKCDQEDIKERHRSGAEDGVLPKPVYLSKQAVAPSMSGGSPGKLSYLVVTDTIMSYPEASRRRPMVTAAVVKAGVWSMADGGLSTRLNTTDRRESTGPNDRCGGTVWYLDRDLMRDSWHSVIQKTS